MLKLHKPPLPLVALSALHVVTNHMSGLLSRVTILVYYYSLDIVSSAPHLCGLEFLIQSPLRFQLDIINKQLLLPLCSDYKRMSSTSEVGREVEGIFRK
jgi:hypothetical protein